MSRTQSGCVNVSVEDHGCACVLLVWEDEAGATGRVRHCAVLSLEAVKRTWSCGAASGAAGEKRSLVTLVAWNVNGAEADASGGWWSALSCLVEPDWSSWLSSSGGAAREDVVSAAEEYVMRQDRISGVEAALKR